MEDRTGPSLTSPREKKVMGCLAFHFHFYFQLLFDNRGPPFSPRKHKFRKYMGKKAQRTDHEAEHCRMRNWHLVFYSIQVYPPTRKTKHYI